MSGLSNTIVLDAGALIALERRDRTMLARVAATIIDGGQVCVPSTIVSQVWRGRASQAYLAKLLQDFVIAPFDPFARRIGELCGKAKTKDVCDAQVALVTLLNDAEAVYTSDREDISHLLAVCGLPDRTVRV